jgi:hypothetical protein
MVNIMKAKRSTRKKEKETKNERQTDRTAERQ